MAVSLPVATVLLLAALAIAPAAADPAPPLARGLARLAAGQPDSALGPLLEAHAAGMPKDSLYYFLSEIARRKAAYDTAMGFNLAVGTPPPGTFRDSVLRQRYRLFIVAGLASDAAAVSDSLSDPPEGDGPDRRRRAGWRIYSGWVRESYPSAFLYPFALDMGGYDPEGAHHRARGFVELPLWTEKRSVGTIGFEAQAVKSFAKDSVDYRLGAGLKAERPDRSGWSAGISAEGGRITGSGWVAGCKAEAGWLSLGTGGLALITGGVASEWDRQGRNRFRNAWLSAFADGTLRSGRGFSALFSVSGLGMDPILAYADFPELYVDDVSKAAPTHFQDASYADTIPATGRATFTRYVSAAGTLRAGSRAPLSCLTAAPALFYSHPLGSGLVAEATLSATGSWYPEAYRWDDGPLPAGSPATGDFRGFARNRADGKAYAAYLIQGNGGFTETYGARPLARSARTRLDGQASLELGVRRAFRGLGALSAGVGAGRNASSLDGAAPIWIAAWNAGAAIKWNGEWKW